MAEKCNFGVLSQDGGSLPCTKMQQPKEGLSPNAVISYNVARR
jgi:hypothetical protein